MCCTDRSYVSSRTLYYFSFRDENIWWEKWWRKRLFQPRGGVEKTHHGKRAWCLEGKVAQGAWLYHIKKQGTEREAGFSLQACLQPHHTSRPTQNWKPSVQTYKPVGAIAFSMRDRHTMASWRIGMTDLTLERSDWHSGTPFITWSLPDWVLQGPKVPGGL